MRVIQIITPKRLSGPAFSSSCRSSAVLTPRTFATTSAFSSSRIRINVQAQPTRTVLQPICLSRTYWWSSKPTPPRSTSNEQLPSSESMITESEAPVSSIQEGSTVSHASSDLGGQSAPSIVSNAGRPSEVLAVSNASHLTAQDNAGVPTSSNSAVDLSSDFSSSSAAAAAFPSPDAAAAAPLGSLEALQAATTEFSALASLDYSHLFSWAWPAGMFLRVFHFFQEMPIIYTSPIACMVVAVIAFRLPLSYFHLRGQKATAAWAPYQEEFKALSAEYQRLVKTGDNIRAMDVAQKLLKIRETTKFSPFAGLAPAFGLMYVGIGSFLGMGKLASYQKEVVAMGGTGPLANPDGFLSTGWLADLTVFDPALFVLFTGLTWWNVRRSALDAAKYSPWMARMPHLITPVFAIISLLVRFSAAQMIVGGASIAYTVAQSYALRVPTIRRAAGMEGVKIQDPKTFKFPGFFESWREAGKYAKEYVESRSDEARKVAEARAGGRVSSSSSSRPEVPRGMVNRDQLKIKDAPPPPRLLSNAYASTLPAPLPPPGFHAAAKNTSSASKTKAPAFKLPPTLHKDKGKVAKRSK